MNRVVLVGGVWSNESMLSGVEKVIDGMKGVLDIYTSSFRHSFGRDKDKVRKASNGAVVVLLSAAAMHADGMRISGIVPKAVTVFNGPEPVRNISTLILRAGLITSDHVLGSLVGNHTVEHGRYLTAAFSEITPCNRPGNFIYLNAIANFSTLAAVRLLADHGIPTELVVASRDTFFPLAEAYSLGIENYGSPCVEFTVFDGLHNDIVIEPERVIGTSGLARVIAGN